MALEGFAQEDFDVFAIPDFADRMAAIRARIRPKLVALADMLASDLAQHTGLPFFPHVAAHARRQVNPPPDTWLALGRNNRGYKRYAHFAVGVQHEGGYIRSVLKPEAEDKRAIATFLQGEGEALVTDPRLQRYFWHGSTWSAAKATGAIRKEDLATLAAALAGRETSWLAVGIDIPRRDERLAEPSSLAAVARGVVEDLLPLYRAAAAAETGAVRTI